MRLSFLCHIDTVPHFFQCKLRELIIKKKGKTAPINELNSLSQLMPSVFSIILLLQCSGGQASVAVAELSMTFTILGF